METLEPYVKKLLDGGMKTAEDIAKFVEVQTPELGKEIITWGAASEIVAPIFGLLLVVVTSWLHCNYRKEKWYIASEDFDTPFVVLNIVAFLIGTLLFFVQIMDVLYPIMAPRLYILEKVSSFIK
jgi:uncharacterized protein with PQ loop repeat